MAGAASLSLRAMTTADLPQVLAIERQVQFAPWSEKLFADGLERGHDCRVAVDAGERVAGFSVVQNILDEAHLLNIAVDPARQGQGVGRQLLTAVTESAAARQASMIFLEVRSGNLRAIDLYNRAGFNEIGLRKNYYPAPGGGKEHAVMMALVP
ncbi:[SSU ribosomal protein S18P]-alanine acetyltransferase [Fluviicoccus keumensis]|uniref:[Ribosomal protein bS18]-alanine N-acetyltransferase n=1 Tax=Fluviicoccus keumensis TaxID=1435465 RepID=A0A4Q7YKH3_9GAMM|nr:ribosomal protein S18-alanine N-acetyltransferase [Fluviicoccus keumensis]RZU36999.1 [SSU ribosomal protein S18P]-alanine acetyltransferase [Fluviicoccus keumensis]